MCKDAHGNRRSRAKAHEKVVKRRLLQRKATPPIFQRGVPSSRHPEGQFEPIGFPGRTSPHKGLSAREFTRACKAYSTPAHPMWVIKPLCITPAVRFELVTSHRETRALTTRTNDHLQTGNNFTLYDLHRTHNCITTLFSIILSSDLHRKSELYMIQFLGFTKGEQMSIWTHASQSQAQFQLNY
ncbi:hypothetical protein LXL04_012764 [Taraxacum kok-saghyz]